MGVETCPLCMRMYARLSQHLTVTHKVENKQERKLLLALESGRVDARAGMCPVPACGKFSSRLDRHIRTHSEISLVAQDEALRLCKRRQILSKLAVLRATNPDVPMLSTLDLEELQELEEATFHPDEEELEEEECANQGCKRQKDLLRTQVVDLNQQVDILTDSLRKVTRRYRILKRRSASLGATRTGQVVRKLLSSLGPEEEDDTPVSPAAPADPADHDQATSAGAPSSSKQSIEQKDKVGEVQPSASGSQQSPEKSPPPYPDHVSALNDMLEDYRRFKEGPDASYKLKENVSCQVYRIKKFIAYMSEGKSKLSDFLFLNNKAKIHMWVSSLRQAHMTVTTLQHYVLNVGCFMQYLAETPPPSCRLSKQSLIGLRREIAAIRRSLKRGVAIHQTAVKTQKEERVISKAILLKCRELAAKAIPDLLSLLENDPNQKNQWQFYGHFAALLSALYGHRGGVFQNITMQEVLGAQRSVSEKVYLINVTSHKTNQYFGPAQIALTEKEWGWVQRFLSIKDKLPGGTNPKYLFFTSTPNPCKNLNNYFQDAWKSMGLPGCPTFTDVRSSIASHARFTHSTEDRLKISKFMCHDLRTADKFYVVNLSAQQAMEHRRLFESALEGAERSPSKQSPVKRKRPSKTEKSRKKRRQRPDESPKSTTSEELVLQLQESGTSSLEGTESERTAGEDGGSSEPEGGAEGTKHTQSANVQPKLKLEEGQQPRRKYPIRTKGALRSVMKPQSVSPLKVRKSSFSPNSTTLMGMSRQKKASRMVKRAIEKRKRRR